MESLTMSRPFKDWEIQEIPEIAPVKRPLCDNPFSVAEMFSRLSVDSRASYQMSYPSFEDWTLESFGEAIQNNPNQHVPLKQSTSHLSLYIYIHIYLSLYSSLSLSLSSLSISLSLYLYDSVYLCLSLSLSLSLLVF